ncbi:acetoacetate decarboxylase family protein [Stutzerimonas azotifigens]|uniref:Acetoacetate decarboxylase family protein n=1 Tax=Stutzerimonas azotifigens TaxID=291995 RepID=A0ABR5YZ26_9GAMM|nr:acetoacetate decarboxylase family protein [Stutzerimonas azotifigens]MBA1273207.1 acetoacetate decarboxylase family protein [Stutzerimonas azotifigens]
MDTHDETRFPQAPWHLTGTACASAWRVPARDLPPVPKGLDYVTLGDTALVLTIWAAYLPGGTLAYNELAVVVAVRRHGMLAPTGTVTHIWVDDERSATGGRELWSIPKQLGDFVSEPHADEKGFAARLSTDGQPVASVSFAPNMSLPGQPSASGFVIQQNDCGLLRTRCRGRGRLVTGRASWDFAATGPLAFLHGRTPMFSLRVRDLQASFGI